MKFFLSMVFVLLGIGALCVPVSADSGQLDWMLGCWTSEDGNSREVWVRQSDEQLLGFSVALQEGSVVFHEVLSIVVNEGAFDYTAHPQGQAPMTFSATGAIGTEVSFINAHHDYPQRVSYKLDGNWLRATISLLDGANPTSFDKKKCQ